MTYNSYTLIGGLQTLRNVHSSRSCAGQYCTIHNPSGHHMKGWHQYFSGGIMYRLCLHNSLHIDPDDPNAAEFSCALRAWAGERPHDRCCIPPLELTIVPLHNLP